MTGADGLSGGFGEGGGWSDFGGVSWRTCLAVSHVAVLARHGTDQPALMRGLAGSGRCALVAGGWRSLVGALCLAVSDWRTDLAV